MRKSSKKNSLSIQNGIFFTFAVLVLVAVVAVSALLLMVLRAVIINEIGKARGDVLSQINMRIQITRGNMISFSNLIYNDSAVKTVMEQAAQAPARKEQVVSTCEHYIQAYKEFGTEMYVVLYNGADFAYCSKEDFYYQFDRISKNLWYSDVVNGHGETVWISSYDDTYLLAQEHFVFSAARIYERQDQTKGILLITVPERSLYAAYEAVLTDDSQIFVLNADGKVVSHSDPNLVGLNYYDMNYFYEMMGDKNYVVAHKSEEAYLLSYSRDEDTGWVVVEEIRLGALLDPLWNSIYWCVGIVAVIIFAGLLMAFLLAKVIVRPINALCQYIRNVREDNLAELEEIGGWRETQNLNQVFNAMIRDINQMLEKVRENERRRRTAELDFLQQQINPHFIYNTLFSIQCVVDMGKRTEAVAMIALFIKLMKMSVNSSNELVYLQEELEWNRSFVDLLRLKYTNAISLDIWYESEDLKRCHIPKMLLQPIVENSVYHGLDRKEDIHIQVTVKRSGDDVTVSLKDNGGGIAKEKLIELNKGIWRKAKLNHVGLPNVRERIKLAFGEQYDMYIASELGKGTEVTLTIPYIY